MPEQPNIVYFHVDNLGMGELGCYGGGILRGADTARADAFAAESLKLSHFVVEPQCTPTRSALMTGRYPIRSGNHTIALGGNGGGIVGWERTMGDILSEAGYATACFGKWHIGAEDGRWPTDHGFDEWYGPARTYDECLWPDDPWYDGDRDGYSYMYEGTKADGVTTTDQQLTVKLKGQIDGEYDRRAKAFMKRSVDAGKPFYLYHNHSLMHFPMEVREEFKGKSTNGAWGDSLLMLDHDFGSILDALTELGIEDNTIVIFAGDNGAEDHLAGRGTAGFFDGSYFSSAEGGIRTPCLIRWPGKVAPRESNEMVHVTDMFPTLLRWAGAEPPSDRIIDGIDQREFFTGETAESKRDGCMVWLNEELHAVKWSQFKINFKRQQHFHDPEIPLGFARITNLLEDPKEREAVNQTWVRWWVMQHAYRFIQEFEDSVKTEELIPAGAPIDFVPARSG
ncbi:arylsulfatase [Mycobacterium sp. NAZ190054]|uniref:arylsulfatase n=1 Tax=Mycobacterium sp. NAZ190054 TaxID=1747766 RepID=UPI000793861D|nr:arylsulfatase [Mycobacterium sp. NAZ190054]KWX67238.1 sulfatase [Mycobacterium sp. NAZ190054]